MPRCPKGNGQGVTQVGLVHVAKVETSLMEGNVMMIDSFDKSNESEFGIFHGGEKEMDKW